MKILFIQILCDDRMTGLLQRRDNGFFECMAQAFMQWMGYGYQAFHLEIGRHVVYQFKKPMRFLRSDHGKR